VPRRERSLVERLLEPNVADPPSSQVNTARFADSVLRNLRNVLNTRQGETPIAPDYGLPDLSEVAHNFPESIAAMRKAIKATIEKFEPRLHRVMVRHIGTPENLLMIKFQIKAQLILEENRSSIMFSTQVDSSGFFKVER
jgi:type VI secretion system protein